MQIGVPAPGPYVVGMADGMTEADALAADFANITQWISPCFKNYHENYTAGQYKNRPQLPQLVMVWFLLVLVAWEVGIMM